MSKKIGHSASNKKTNCYQFIILFGYSWMNSNSFAKEKIKFISERKRKRKRKKKLVVGPSTNDKMME